MAVSSPWSSTNSPTNCQTSSRPTNSVESDSQIVLCRFNTYISKVDDIDNIKNCWDKIGFIIRKSVLPGEVQGVVIKRFIIVQQFPRVVGCFKYPDKSIKGILFYLYYTWTNYTRQMIFRTCVARIIEKLMTGRTIREKLPKFWLSYISDWVIPN